MIAVMCLFHKIFMERPATATRTEDAAAAARTEDQQSLVPARSRRLRRRLASGRLCLDKAGMFQNIGGDSSPPFSSAKDPPSTIRDDGERERE